MNNRITIEGREFAVKADRDTYLLCNKIRKDAAMRLALLKKSNITGDTAKKQTESFLEDCLEKLLGKGAAEAIFRDRQRELQELSKAVCSAISQIGGLFDQNPQILWGEGEADSE